MRLISLLFILLGITSCKAPVKSPPDFDWQGHRGARGIYPENSIPAFLFALDQGVNTLELDVVITADLQVVASHEPFLSHEICLDIDGEVIKEEDVSRFNIFQMTYRELAKFDCGTKKHPHFPEQQSVQVHKPLLSEIIEAAELHALETNRPAANYNIEIKSRPEWDGQYHPAVSDYVDLVIAVAKKSGVLDRVSIQSFDKRVLLYLHHLSADVRLVLLEEDTRNPSVHIDELGFLPDVYSCYYRKVDKELVDYCHAQGMKVIPWTVNERNDMKRLIEFGVDGIITDYPNLIPRFIH